jgi:hypothetical protein
MEMEIDGVTWVGPTIDAPDILSVLPQDLAQLLSQINGFVLRGGALHVRGAVRAPEWHSLANAWQGSRAFHLLYPVVSPDDIPFAQDCLGDQFLLRHGRVVRLSAEHGELEPLDIDLSTFLASASHDPVEFLLSEPLLTQTGQGGRLQPGELLLAYPPYCTNQASQGTALKAVPAVEVIEFHADFARRIRDLPDGSRVRIVVE